MDRAPLVATLATIYDACIAEREDRFLQQRFGAAWDEWAVRVPRAIPTLADWRPAERPFDWRVVVRREFYALALILIVPMILDVAEDLHETGGFELDPVWTVTAGVGSALFVALRFLKKRTSRLAVPRATAGTSGPRR